ncbi:MAG: RnfABCDGE type electron transport complex subunit G [Candidatus Eisenbacteria bacterium]|nr:RnfABCDGE type electron transport complex subunit G [Candidatus Eisenbacteria bacterium]
MSEIPRMLIVLTLICAACALLLSGVRSMTADQIERQILVNVQGPAVEGVLEGSENDLIADRRDVRVDDRELTVFVGKRGGDPWAIAYQTSGVGFGGDVEVIAGFDVTSDEITGLRVVMHKETPGIGSKVTEEQFTKQFDGRAIEGQHAIEPDGGDIESVTGATYSSRAAAEGLQKAAALYDEVKQQVLTP